MKKRNILTLICIVAASINARAQAIDGSWKGDMKVGPSSLAVVINIKDGKCTMDSPDQGAFGIETTVNHLSADSLNISIPAIGGTLAGRRNGDTLKGAFAQMGMGFPIDLKKTLIERKRPQTPRPPFG